MTIYPEITKLNMRGDAYQSPDMDHPVHVSVNAATDRQSDAELVGNVSNKLLKVIARKLPVSSWALIIFRGEEWDVAIPPTQSQFTKRTSHFEFIIRSRNRLDEED